MTLINLLRTNIGAAALSAALNACGDTYVYNVGSDESSQENETYTCETAVANTWDCGLYKDDGDYGDPDFYQKLIKECHKLTSDFKAQVERDPSFLPTWEKSVKMIECASTYSCSESFEEKCGKYEISH